MAPKVADNVELGTLVVVVLKGRNLKDSHKFYKQDPYTVVRFGGIGKSTKPDPRGGQTPVWDEELHFPVLKNATDRSLKITCFSKETKIDETLGEGSVDMTNTIRTGEFDDWVQLTLDNQHRGDIYLECTFYSAAPPLVRRPSKLKPSERVYRPPVTPPKDPGSLPSSGASSRHHSPSRVPGAAPANPSSGFLSVPNAAGVGAHNLAPQGHGTPPRVPSILRPTHPKSNPLGNPQNSNAHGITDLLQPRMNNREADLPLDLYPSEPPLPNPFDKTSPRSYPEHQVQTGSGAQPARQYQRPQPVPSSSPPRARQPAQAIPPARTSPRTQPPDLPARRQHQDQSPTRPQPQDPPPRYSDRNQAQAHPPPLPRRSESPLRRPLSPRSQAKADEDYAHAIARSEGIDLARLQQEEKDKELARKIWEDSQAGEGRTVPGGWRT